MHRHHARFKRACFTMEYSVEYSVLGLGTFFRLFNCRARLWNIDSFQPVNDREARKFIQIYFALYLTTEVFFRSRVLTRIDVL